MAKRALEQLYYVPASIGRGGCATVYEAVHRESGVMVALKICQQSDAIDYAINEWIAYERLQLHCPSAVGIPRSLEFGVIRNNDESVSLWIALELLGSNLEDLTRRGQIGRQRFLQVRLLPLHSHIWKDYLTGDEWLSSVGIRIGLPHTIV